MFIDLSIGLGLHPEPSIIRDGYRLIASRLPTPDEARVWLDHLWKASEACVAQALRGKTRDTGACYSAERLRREGIDVNRDRVGLGLHWSGSLELERTVRDLAMPGDQLRVSSHFVIDWDGSLVWLYPLDVATWHGAENRSRIGVDLVHPGWLDPRPDGGFQDWARRRYPAALPPPVKFPRATMPEGHGHHQWWAGYTVQQCRSLIVLGRALRATVPFRPVGSPFLRGHYEVNRQKPDPWHYPLRHCERSILEGEDVLHTNWWAIEIGHAGLQQFVINHRKEGTL